MTSNDQRARVLIIEDDPDIASFEETMLTRAGYQTKIANTGADGLASVGSYRPDVVLLDIGLPDMSGLDVCTTIAETADAYILMVSGHASEDIKLTGLGLGADDFISKPFSGNESARFCVGANARACAIATDGCSSGMRPSCATCTRSRRTASPSV